MPATPLPPVRHHVGVHRRIALVTIALTAAAVGAWVASGAGGGPASCVPACDCETIGGGRIAQPANAWTALAIVAAGGWTAGRARTAPRAIAGTAVALIGLAAFSAHASVTALAYRAEGAALAGAAWAVALAARPRWAVALSAVAGLAAWALDSPWSLALAGGGLVGLAASTPARAVPGRLVLAAGLLGTGLAIRFLSDDGGPWCRPDAPLTGHAFWHVLAAAGLALLAVAMDGARGTPGLPGPDLPSGPAPASTERG